MEILSQGEAVSDRDPGDLIIKPDHPVQVGEIFDLEFRYQVGRQTIPPGSHFIIEWRENRFFRERDAQPGEAGFIEVANTGQASLQAELIGENYSAWLHSQTYGIRVRVEGHPLVSGDVVTVNVHQPNTAPPYRMSTLPFPTTIKFFIRFEIEDEISYLDPEVRLEIISGEPERLKVILPSGAQIGEPVPVVVQALDHWSNVSEQYQGEVELACQAPGLAWKLVLGAQHKGETRTEVEFASEGIHYLEARDRTRNFRALSNPIKVEANPERQVYFGDIHGKVWFSHGTKGPDDYYRYARDIAKLDFGATACMVDWPHPGGERTDGSQYLDARPLTDEDWESLQQAARKYHEPGNFVTFLGFEWQRDDDLCRVGCPDCQELKHQNFGDRNVYYLRDDQPLFHGYHPDTCSPQRLFDRLRGREALVIPHHSSAPGPKGANWDLRDDELMRLVEIYSKWGASEYPGNPRPCANYSLGSFVQDALHQGHRLGFIGSSDTHLSLPGGDILEQPPNLRYSQPGLACVWAEAKTREAIFEALRQRRCYATTGVRMLLDFQVNGHPMGSEFSLESEEPRKIKLWVAGTDRIEGIDIIRNGENLRTYVPANQWFVELELEDREPLGDIALDAPGRPPFVYYYLRVTQAEWTMAWSSPVWIDLK